MRDLLKGKVLMIGCPKFDDTGNMWTGSHRSLPVARYKNHYRSNNGSSLLLENAGHHQDGNAKVRQGDTDEYSRYQQ